jgi:sporulation protein YlmC with PRC-barrel domain
MSMTDLVDLDLDLLDRLVVDRDGEPVARVDDVELELHDGTLVLTALLVGPEALGGRIGGRVGRWLADAGRRLRTDLAEPPRIPMGLVEELGDRIRLSVHREDLDFPRSEAWFRDHLVDRLPGREDT